MKKANQDDYDPVSLDELITEILVDIHEEDEKFDVFQRYFKENIAVPCDAFVIGRPVSVIGFDYDGNKRRGLTASCRCEDGSVHAFGVSVDSKRRSVFLTGCFGSIRPTIRVCVF